MRVCLIDCIAWLLRAEAPEKIDLMIDRSIATCLVDQLRPRLVPSQKQKNFKIPRHIKSCGTCMEY